MCAAKLVSAIFAALHFVAEFPDGEIKSGRRCRSFCAIKFGGWDGSLTPGVSSYT